jgi:hypothetical protein
MIANDRHGPNKAKNEQTTNNHQPMKFWWLRQRDPIARFTLYVALFTFALVGVGVLQAVILSRTDDTSREAQRAAVYVREIKRRDFTTIANNPGFYYFAVFANGGTTPTKHLKYRTMCSNREFLANQVDFVAYFRKYKTPWTPGYLGPGASQEILTCTAAGDFIRDSIVKNNGWNFFGEASYADTYKTPHWMTFCYEASLGNYQSNDIIVSPCFSHGAEKYNCSDDDCIYRKQYSESDLR